MTEGGTSLFARVKTVKKVPTPMANASSTAVLPAPFSPISTLNWSESVKVRWLKPRKLVTSSR
jgi:hypothetical protein